MSSLSLGMEVCSWDNSEDVTESLGSECNWSEEEAASSASPLGGQLILTPTLAPRPAEIDSDPSPLPCDWSESEEFSSDPPILCRRSPRHRKRKRLFDPSPTLMPGPSPLARLVVATSPPTSLNTETWNLFDAMNADGCNQNCTRTVHGLSEYDVLMAHSSFASKTVVEQRKWIFDYLATHCPNDSGGQKDVKNITFVVSGKRVCLSAWMAVLSISSSRFYDIRKEFVDGQAEPTPKRSRSMSVKSQQAIAWMSSYFERVGDKRPDKDGIYLPTCLTEKAIHSQMIEELYKGKTAEAVCCSQFNRLFKTNFPNVTIPKVHVFGC